MTSLAGYTRVAGRRSRPISAGAVVLGAALVYPSLAASAPVKVIKYTPQMQVSALAGQADTDLVELSNGRRISVKTLRQLDALARTSRAVRPRGPAPVLLVKPAGTGIPVKDGPSLAAALERPDGTTIQLPNGMRATVGQIKYLQPLIEKELGHPLSSLAQRSGLSGPAVKVGPTTAQETWVSIFKTHPDSEVLELPDGQRLTLGELKQMLRERLSTRMERPTPASMPLSAMPAAKRGQR